MEAEWKDLIHCTEFTGRQKIYQTKETMKYFSRKKQKKKTVLCEHFKGCVLSDLVSNSSSLYKLEHSNISEPTTLK